MPAPDPRKPTWLDHLELCGDALELLGRSIEAGLGEYESQSAAPAAHIEALGTVTAALTSLRQVYDKIVAAPASE